MILLLPFLYWLAGWLAVVDFEP
eukprot:COSAG02_NODE_40040_length_409_cov_2.800000_2_plen_22_part_01